MLRFKRIWCRLWHPDIMFLGGQTYECRSCGLVWPNPWYVPHKKPVNDLEWLRSTVEEAHGTAE